MVNENKIAFIVCANNEVYYNECVWYIEHLYIPEGYEIDVICITGAEGMAQGYNAAMKDSDAKYKVYLHQDVFIYNRYFIKNILEIFHSDSEVGMLGVYGGNDLPTDAEIWCSWNLGGTYGCDYEKAGYVHGSQDSSRKWMEADAIDGMLMVTQYDFEWREDLMLGWDFYDVSQSLEFVRKGYKIVIPYQEDWWCMHDCGNSNLLNYDNARQRIMEEYKEFFPEDFKPLYDLKKLVKQCSFFDFMKECFEQGRLEEVLPVRNAIRDSKLSISNNDLQIAVNILDIYAAEKNDANGAKSFFSDVYIWGDIIDKYNKIKFITRHAENDTNDQAVEELISLMKNRIVSRAAVIIICKHSTIKTDKAINRLFYRG